MKSTITTAALAQLTRSPLNVRETKKNDPAIRQLAASILAKGLISPLAVHALAKPKGKLGVLAGDRRWQAIQRLHADKAAFDFEAIPVLLLEGTDAELTEISLAENYVRQGMRPAEIYAAFRAIRERDPAMTDEELGKHYGLNARETARIMRLAFLHPDVFAAYAAGKLDDEQAFAYAATADQALQLSVFERLRKGPKHEHYPHNIRRAMKVGSDEHRLMLCYVGLDAYEGAGGRFEVDLFADQANSGRVMDEEILARGVNEKLAVDRDAFERLLRRNGRKIETDGAWGLADLAFEWAEEPPTVTQYGYTSIDYELRLDRPGRGKLSDEDEARAKALKTELEGIGAKIVNARPDEAKQAALKEEAARMRDELDELLERRPIILPKKGAIVGVTRINHHGRLDITLYYASRKEKGVAEPKSGKASAASRTPEEKQRLAWGLTKDNMQAMLMLRRDMIREQLLRTAASGLALDFLIFSQARTILVPAGRSWDGKPHIDGAPVGIATPAAQDTGSMKPPATIVRAYETLTGGPAYREASARLAASDWATIRDPVEGFMLYRAAPKEDRLDAAAIVAGHGILASTSFYGEGRTPRMVEDLACLAEGAKGRCDWAETVTYDEAFFELISHKARIALLTSWGMDEQAKRLKKADSAAYCARVMKAAVERDEVELAKLGIDEDFRDELGLWRPEWLDTRTVGDLPAEAPEDDADEPGDDEDVDVEPEPVAQAAE